MEKGDTGKWGRGRGRKEKGYCSPLSMTFMHRCVFVVNPYSVFPFSSSDRNCDYYYVFVQRVCCYFSQSASSPSRHSSSFDRHSTCRASELRSRHAASWCRPSGARPSCWRPNWAVCEPARAHLTHRDWPDVGRVARMRRTATGSGVDAQRHLALICW